MNRQLEIDRNRIVTLLHINTLLLSKIMQIQQQLPSQSPQQQQQLQECVQHYMRRVHANLTCIAEINTKWTKERFDKVVTLSIMDAPPMAFENLNEYYGVLQKLFA